MGLGSQPFWQLTGCACNNTNTISVECNIKFVKTFTDITIQLDTKQAGRHWYDTLFRALADLGFQKTQGCFTHTLGTTSLSLLYMLTIA